MQSSFFAMIGILAVMAPLIFITVRKSIWTELEIITGGVSAIMFAFLTVVLFLGVRFNKAERLTIAWPKTAPRDVFDAMSAFPDGTGGLFTEMGSEAGPLGFVVGLLLDIVATIIMLFLISVILWIGINALYAIVLAVSIPLFYFYRRSIRMIVLKGRTCRHSWNRSAIHAFRSSVLYTAWFYAILVLAHHIERVRIH